MSQEKLKNILEAAMFAAQRPLVVDELAALFEGSEWRPERKAIREALGVLADEWQDRGIELKEVASGFRFQVRKDCSGWLGNLWSERPPRYTRALLETLALVVYRQPITRGEIEDVRGVSVSPSIIKTLIDREWIRVLGHKDVPGRPELFGTTRQFLDSFSLKSLDELPPLSEIRDLDNLPDDLFAAVPLAVVDTTTNDEGDTEGNAEGHEEGHAEEHAEGHEEGHAEEHAQEHEDEHEDEREEARAKGEPAASGAD